MDDFVSPGPAFWSGSGSALMACGAERVASVLATQQILQFRTTEAEVSVAWAESLAALIAALVAVPGAATWHILLEYRLLRLGRRIDVVLLTPRAIVVLEFKREQADLAAQRQVEDYALDLFDFHAGSRTHPVVPILVSGGAPSAPSAMPLFWGVTSVFAVRPNDLGSLLAEISLRAPCPAAVLDAGAWLRAPYCPVPTIVEAACMAYALMPATRRVHRRFTMRWQNT